MGFKQPVSVLVIVYACDTHRVLMLQRRDDIRFWQSVTGSLEVGETPYEAALREVQEELGIHVLAEGLMLQDCHYQVEYEIFPQYRHRYAPSVTHNHESWFLLGLPTEREPILTEHLAACWLDASDAACLTLSWSNRQAIMRFL